MATILFVCTGNIFRSLTAEYALRAQLPPSQPHRVRSAGIEAHPEPVAATVRDRLLARGVDCRGHLHEALPDWSCEPEASQRYIVRTVDHIWKAMPAFIARLPDWVR